MDADWSWMHFFVGVIIGFILVKVWQELMGND